MFLFAWHNLVKWSGSWMYTKLVEIMLSKNLFRGLGLLCLIPLSTILQLYGEKCISKIRKEIWMYTNGFNVHRCPCFVYLSVFIPNSFIEFFSIYYQEVFCRLQYTTFRSNRSSSVNIVTSYHSHTNTSLLTFLNSIRYLKYINKYRY